MSDQEHANKICDNCKKSQHNECEDRSKCSCECNKNKTRQHVAKGLATVGGLASVVGGLFLTIGTGGLALPIAIPLGGAFMGAGFSSTYQGISKTINKKDLKASEYFLDVGFGTVTGVATGGIGSLGELAVANVAKEGAVQVVKSLGIRAVTGIVSGTAAKAVDEVKQCATTDKQWSDYGKTLDKDGNYTASGTVASWASSAIAGSLGGAATQLSSSASNVLSSGLQKAGARVLISGTTASAADAVCQTINIAAGNQEEYDPKQTILAGTISSVTTAAMEGTRSGIMSYKGGEKNLLQDKANKDMIAKIVPEEDQASAIKAYEEAKNLPDKDKIDLVDNAKRVGGPKIGKSNLHGLSDRNQIAADVIDPSSSERGLARIVFDRDLNSDGTVSVKVAGYTDKHDYKSIPGFGKSDFNTFYDKVDNQFKIINNTLEFEQKNLLTNLNSIKKDDEHESEDIDKKIN